MGGGPAQLGNPQCTALASDVLGGSFPPKARAPSEAPFQDSEKCGLGLCPAWVRSMVGKPDRTNSASEAPFQDSEKCGLGLCPSEAPFQDSG
jgi:hypothetical protein